MIQVRPRVGRGIYRIRRSTVPNVSIQFHQVVKDYGFRVDPEWGDSQLRASPILGLCARRSG